MRIFVTIGAMTAALLVAGCGGPDEPEQNEKAPMKVEDTAFGPLIGTQDQARDRANAAVEEHRENLDERLEEDEGT